MNGRNTNVNILLLAIFSCHIWIVPIEMEMPADALDAV